MNEPPRLDYQRRPPVRVIPPRPRRGVLPALSFVSGGFAVLGLAVMSSCGAWFDGWAPSASLWAAGVGLVAVGVAVRDRLGRR